MKKKYYLLRSPSDPKIIGIRDGYGQAESQRQGFKNKSHYDEIINFFNKTNANIGKFPSFEINLEYVKMEKKAKLTDFISFYPVIPYGYFLVSEHVVKILSTFKLPKHKFYSATIEFKEEKIHNYKLFYCPPLEDNLIDYTKSIFFSGNELLGKKFHSFSSREEYQAHIKHDFLRAEKIYINKGFNNEFDYFNIEHFSGGLISTDLKETFEIAGITGIKFLEPKEPELIFE